MRLTPRIRSAARYLKWWLLPSPNRFFIDVAGFMVSVIVAQWAEERRYTALWLFMTAITLVFMMPLPVSGFWLIIRTAIVDPLRGYLVRRATGEAVYFHEGVMRPSVNRRSQREVSETPDNRRHQPTADDKRRPADDGKRHRPTASEAREPP